MKNPLATYLEDHLAGALEAIELTEAICKQHSREELGDFASNLLIEIKKDRDTLHTLAERVGAGSSTVKDVTAWVGEKITLLKLNRRANDGLGTFEALEFLSLGIYGKLSLWRALAIIAPVDPRLLDVDFQQLAERAEQQRAQVEERRLAMVREALMVQHKAA
jgi:hypothetical protein